MKFSISTTENWSNCSYLSIFRYTWQENVEIKIQQEIRQMPTTAKSRNCVSQMPVLRKHAVSRKDNPLHKLPQRSFRSTRWERVKRDMQQNRHSVTLKPDETHKCILEMDRPHALRFEPLKEKHGRLRDPLTAPLQ